MVLRVKERVVLWILLRISLLLRKWANASLKIFVSWMWWSMLLYSWLYYTIHIQMLVTKYFQFYWCFRLSIFRAINHGFCVSLCKWLVHCTEKMQLCLNWYFYPQLNSESTQKQLNNQLFEDWSVVGITKEREQRNMTTSPVAGLLL